MSKKFKKIVVLDSVIFYPEHRDRLNEIAEDVVEYNTCETEEEVLARVKGADCIISCWVDISNRVIDENPQLKTVAFWTHAYEHRIDKEHALKHGLHVPSIPDYGTDSVAELAFIGLLQLYKNNENILGLSRMNDSTYLQEEIMAKIIKYTHVSPDQSLSKFKKMYNYKFFPFLIGLYHFKRALSTIQIR